MSSGILRAMSVDEAQAEVADILRLTEYPEWTTFLGVYGEARQDILTQLVGTRDETEIHEMRGQVQILELLLSTRERYLEMRRALKDAEDASA